MICHNHNISGQCLEKVPKTRVISEPFSFVGMNALYVKGDVSFIEYRNLLESTFRLQCKIEKDSDIDRNIGPIKTLQHLTRFIMNILGDAPGHKFNLEYQKP